MDGYLGLLISAFLAATILPVSSEVVLVGLAASNAYDLKWLWLVATLGNVVGSMVNGWLGRSCLRFQERRWFPISGQTLEQARHRFLRYGVWSLLFAWVPIIGDPLTVVAGMLRTPWPQFLLLVTLGKGGRYLVVLAFFL